MTVEIVGELDLASAPLVTSTVSEAVSEAMGRGVVLDLQDVVFIDSVGIGALVRVHKFARRAGVPCALVMGQRVRRVLNIVGMTQAFDSFEDPAQAQAHAAGQN